MSNAFAKIIGKKILGETVANQFGTDDPYFEQVPATRLNGSQRPGKFKKKRKALPPGISENDAKVLTKVKRRAYRLDLSLFNCCGLRFGWSSVIAIVPFAGDALDAIMAYMVVATCSQIDGGLPDAVYARMLLNIALDFGIGLVPFLGDVADAMFKCNTRNAALLEKHLRDKGKKTLRNSGVPIPAVDPSAPEEFDRYHGSASPPEYEEHPPALQGPMAALPPAQSSGVTTPAAAPPAGSAQAKPKSGGFFGFGSRSKAHDVEMGNVNAGRPAPK